MMWITLFLFLLPIAADAWHFYGRRRKEGRLPALEVAAAALVDLLPWSGFVLFWFVGDNTERVMLAAMWIFYVYLLLTLPRMIYYMVCALGGNRAVRLIALAAATAAAGVLIHGAASGRRTIVVNRVVLHCPRLPQAFEGLRVAQFSDLHLGTLISPASELHALVDSLNALDADVVIFCGDLVNIRYTELNAAAMRQLGSIRSRLGTYSVTGNHDTGRYIRDTLALPPEVSLAALHERQMAMGWHVLDNRTATLRRGGDSITLSGIAYDPALFLQRHDRTLPDYDFGDTYRGVPQAAFNITAVHIPQLWERITEAGYGDLTLAGHVHSMQCKLHLFGRDFSPARLFYPRWSGLYEQQGRRLYINDGIGCVGFPMRIGADPEITLIELRR